MPARASAFARWPIMMAAVRPSTPVFVHHGIEDVRAAAADEKLRGLLGHAARPRSARSGSHGAGLRPALMAATRASVTRVGGESVSGYIRSGPGRMRSNVV